MNFNGYLYNITRIGNLPSIIEKGILSQNECDSQRVTHQSFALASVQEKRDSKVVPNGLSIHDYACLYFDPRNKAMFHLRHNDTHFSEICILVLGGIELLNVEGAVISDMNAAAAMVNFYPANDVTVLNFDRIYAKYWTHPENPSDERLHGYQKCAELLIPNRIDSSHILGAYVQSQEMGDQIIGMCQKVKVDKGKFFL